MKGGSTSHKVLQVALHAAQQAGAVCVELALCDLGLPIYIPGLAPTAEVLHFVDQVASAQALLLCTPVYHGGMTGALKNALDWLELLGDRTPAYLTNKVVGLLAVSAGAQGMQAINSLEFVVRALRGFTLPLTLPIERGWDLFDEHEHIKEGPKADRLRLLGHTLVETARKLSV